jgi:hypothetical protein
MFEFGEALLVSELLLVAGEEFAIFLDAEGEIFVLLPSA